ncbi:MAG: hypothetical protein HY752_04765 [Nitrospirae bacterium]|nr:hypothetical protein [Nitrospirota bacterium]
MLNHLPFPKKLKYVSDYAAAHHERLDGTGYPFKLKAEQIPYQARIIAIADIFEALDMPYKKPMKLLQVLKIMEFMRRDGHIDGNILVLFIREKIYENYARCELSPSQIDC